MQQGKNNKREFKKNPSTKEDNGIVVEGVVMEIGGGGNYIVKIDAMDLTVNAYVSGRLKKNKINIMKGDKVQIKLNEYDPTKGIITFRLK